MQLSAKAEELVGEYRNSPIALGEAFLLGELSPSNERIALEVVTLVVLEAAKIRLDNAGLLARLPRRLAQLR